MRPGNPEPDQPAEPLLSVVAGQPTDEELAALAAVVAGLAAGDPQEALPVRPPHRAWARRRMLSLAPKPGPGSWRRSYR